MGLHALDLRKKGEGDVVRAGSDGFLDMLPHEGPLTRPLGDLRQKQVHLRVITEAPERLQPGLSGLGELTDSEQVVDLLDRLGRSIAVGLSRAEWRLGHVRRG